MRNADDNPVETRSRRRWWLLAIPFLVGGALSLVLVFSLNSNARSATTKLCEDAFHAPVKIGRTDLQIPRGMAAIDQFALGNPSGFEEPAALRFLRLDGFLNVSSLFGRVIELRDLQIVKPEFTVEYRDGRFH